MKPKSMARVNVTISVTRKCGHQYQHQAAGTTAFDAEIPDLMLSMARSAVHDMAVVPHRCTQDHKPTENPIEGQCDDCGLL